MIGYLTSFYKRICDLGPGANLHSFVDLWLLRVNLGDEKYLDSVKLNILFFKGSNYWCDNFSSFYHHTILGY